MSRGLLIILLVVFVVAGCDSGTSSNSTRASASAMKAEPSSVALARVFDPKVVEGPGLGIDDIVSVSELRGCDAPPLNSVEGGNALLQKRRQNLDSGFAAARAEYIVSDSASSEDLKRLTGEIRVRYEREVLSQIPVLPLLGIDTDPFTVRYLPSFSDRNDEVKVHGRRLTLRVAGATGTEESVLAYFLNYDRLHAAEPAVILILAGEANHDPTKFELDPRGNYASTVAGRLASEGWPVIVLDDNQPTLTQSLAAMRALDRAVLVRFARVHVMGVPDAVFHFVMLHESPVSSAYVAGAALPLWTRNDSFFPKDPRTQNPVVQQRFQWADFGLAALDQRIVLAVANNAGQSGAAKAAFFVETLPILQKHPAAAQHLRIVGNDRDGDGKGDHGEACHDGDTADYRAFFREQFAPRSSARQ